MTRPRYLPLAEELAERIRDGALAPGTRLPTVRALMRRHGIALATAARVYTELEAQGLVVGETGRGTFVRDAALPRGHGLRQFDLPAGTADLGFNYPALPGQDELLRDGLRELAAGGGLAALLHSAPQGGRPHERAIVAAHLRRRGLHLPGSQVLIANGAQHGLAATLLALLRPGDAIAADALTYPGLRELAPALHLELHALPAHDHGTDLDALAALCRRRRVRAVYAMPTLHNPLGWVMPVAARRRLAALAHQHDFLLLEDAAYAFLAEPAPAPLFVHAPRRTVYVSGLSKSVAAGLRFGFIAAAPEHIPALEQAIRVSAWNTPSLTTALACRWLQSGLVDSLEQRKRQDARKRQRIARRLLSGCDLIAHPASYFIWLRLAPGCRAEAVAARLAQQGVLLTTAAPFATTRHAPAALRLSLGSVSHTLLEQALEKVRAAIHDVELA